MLRVAIVDDEVIFQNELQGFIEKIFTENGIEYKTKCFGSGKEVEKLEAALSGLDIFFLDINMEGVDGIEVARIIRKHSEYAYIVFVTAYIDYSLEGYMVDAIRYVLKDDRNFEDCLNECRGAIVRKIKCTIPNKMFVFNEGEKRIPLEKILYVERACINWSFT